MCVTVRVKEKDTIKMRESWGGMVNWRREREGNDINYTRVWNSKKFKKQIVVNIKFLERLKEQTWWMSKVGTPETPPVPLFSLLNFLFASLLPTTFHRVHLWIHLPSLWWTSSHPLPPILHYLRQKWLTFSMRPRKSLTIEKHWGMVWSQVFMPLEAGDESGIDPE